MHIFNNIVLSGYCKGGEIKLKGLLCKPVLIKKGLFGKTEIPLNKDKVADYQVIETQHELGDTRFRSKITFKNGGESIVYVTGNTHNAILKRIL